MKTKHLIALFLFLALGAGGLQAQSVSKYVNASQKALRKGQIPEACLQAMEALKLKPSKKNVQQILSENYAAAQTGLLEETAMLKDSSLQFANDRTVAMRHVIVDNYITLQKMDKAYGETMEIVKNSKYPLEFERINVDAELAEAVEALDEAKQLAAEMHYAEGLELLALGGIDPSRKAAREFQTASSLVPGYKDSVEKYREARAAGTIRVAVIPFQNRSGNPNYGAIGELLAARLESELLEKAGNLEFVQIVPRQQVNQLLAEHNLAVNQDYTQEMAPQYGQAAGVHVIVTGQISQVNVQHQQPTTTAPEKVSGREVVDYEEYINEKGKKKKRPIYGTVYATFSRHEKRVVASLAGSVQVVNAATGELLESRGISETNEWWHCWVTYHGDERVVPFNGCNLKDTNPPPNVQLVNETLSQAAVQHCNPIIATVK